MRTESAVTPECFPAHADFPKCVRVDGKGWNLVHGRMVTMRHYLCIECGGCYDCANGCTSDPVDPERDTLAALHGMAYALLRLRSVGGELSEVQKRFQMRATMPPSPGDLVVELSTLGLFGRDPEQDKIRIAYWLRDAWEPHEGRDRPEHVVYVRRIDDGTEVRWVNAEFMRLPGSVEAAEMLFDNPCACGEVKAVRCGTHLTKTGRHSLTGCEEAES